MKTQIALILFYVLAAIAAAKAQIYDTNYVVISGGGNQQFNATYFYSYVPGGPGGGGAQDGYYYEVSPVTNALQYCWQLVGTPGTWEIGPYYTTNFPFGPWADQMESAATNPPPTGTYLITNMPATSLWSFTMTNFWPLPNDFVNFNALGRNIATTNNWPTNATTLEVLLDGNPVFTSTPTAGNGNIFSLNGRLEWDGTNMNTYCQFSPGDPTNPQTAQFNQFTNYAIGTNTFEIGTLGNTNGFILLSASVTASRVLSNSVPMPGKTVQGLGSASFVITN